MKTKCIYKNRLGFRGEIIAKDFLSKKNLKFIKSNFRFERAEVDLIFESEKDKILIFAEVKTRRTLEYGNPEESVTLSKQNRIKKAAMGFVMNNEKYSDYDLRMDVVSIFIDMDEIKINHIENAF